MAPLDELAKNRELHHLIPAALSRSDVNARDYRGHTPLHLALESGCSLETLNVLKEAGADFGARDAFGENALVFALRGNCSGEVMNELLEYDWEMFFAKLFFKKDRPLRLAAEKKRLYLFIPIIAKHQKIDYRDSRDDMTLLHFALKYDCLRSVEAILQYISPSSLNETEKNDFSYLHFAIKEGCSHMKIRALLNAGVNAATKNKFGDTALHLAIRKGCPQPVETILQFMSPSSLNETDDDGDTYLHFAVRMHCRFEEVCALLNAGVNPSTKNYVGENALNVLISKKWHGSGDFRGILKELLRGHPELIEERNRCLEYPIDEILFTDIPYHCRTILKWVLLQNGAEFQWSRISSEPSPCKSHSAILRNCRSDLELLRAFMVTDTLSLGDLVKACYVSPKFVNELRVEKRFTRVLQFEGILTVYEEEVRDIVRMVRVCSSLYGKTLPFLVLKNGAYVNVSQKVLDYLSVDDLEKLNIAINFA